MADPIAVRAHAQAEARLARKREAEECPDKYKELYFVLKKKCSEVESANQRLSRRVYKSKKVLEHVNRERSILMEKLDQYEDGYRDAAKTIQAHAITSITSIAGGHMAVTTEAEAVIGFPFVRGGQGRLTSGDGAALGSPSTLDDPGLAVVGLSQDFTPPPSNTPGGKKGYKKSSPGGATGASPQGVHGAKAGSGVAEKGKPKPDPNAPKKPSNAFFMYSQFQRTSIQEEYQASAVTGHHELTKLIAKKWNELPTEEKKVYYDMYEKDKERYAIEMRSYQQTGAMPGASSSSNGGTSKKKASALAAAGGNSGGSTPKRTSAAVAAASASSAATTSMPMVVHSPQLEQPITSLPPASIPMFDDDISMGNSATLVHTSSPLMVCTPDILSESGVPADVGFASHLPLGDSDPVPPVGVVAGIGISSTDPSGLDLVNRPALTLNDAGLSLEEDEDLSGMYPLDDGGSSAGLDPQEAASIARSFEDDGGDDGEALHMDLPQTLIDN